MSKGDISVSQTPLVNIQFTDVENDPHKNGNFKKVK
jgi:hypothetical protein